MPRPKSKKKESGKKKGSSRSGKAVAKPLNPLRAGMPALDSITSVKEMKRGAKTFRIIKTTETDDYDVREGD